MKKLILVFVLAIVTSLSASDIIVKQSNCSVDKTVKNIKKIVKKKGLSVFATINHKGNAKMVGMKLRASKMVIFGNPKLGTALMKQDMRVGLDLPLRILVFKDKNGKVQMAYRDGSWLADKHIIDAPKKVQKINKGMDNITTKAGQCKKG
ncbi:DUF302 domain-containing protein [Sulfurimonas sp.]|uniref:DUF302 domain-containing protein n=1 Tax=Sulfurimonas sp. TaxID=2022749 RepID=UPI002AB1A211|nr:DUF302 domain-containing protein [Sulfurimonas sp.]